MKKIFINSILILASTAFANAQKPDASSVSDCKPWGVVDCEKQVTESQLWTNATYTGCVDLFDKPNGYGVQNADTYQKSGCWLNGKENGYFTIKRDDGMEEYCNYENGNKVGECKTLLDNRYSKNDVVSPKKSFDINLLNNNGHDFIKITIGSSTDVFLYDTGATQSTMTRELFNSIPSEMRGEKLYTTKGDGSGSFSVQQADGTFVVVEYYLFKEITIQEITIKNVIFGVALDGGSNLIGQDFWNKFSKKNPPKKGIIRVYK